MNKDVTLLFGILLVVLAGVGFWLAFDGREAVEVEPRNGARVAPPEADPSRAARRPGRIDGPGTTALEASGSTRAGASSATATDRADGARLIGRITDPAGAGLGGVAATLCLDVSDHAHISLQGEVYATVVSEPDGRYEITGVAAVRDYILRFDHADYACRLIPGITFESGQERTLDVRLDPGLAVTGRVLGDEGRPIDGAEVIAYDQLRRADDPTRDMERITTTDGRGEFTLGHLNAGYKRVTVRKSGFASSTAPSVLLNEGQEAAPLEFQLRAGASIEGIVRDAAGPVADVIVQARPVGMRGPQALTTNYPPVKTGADGRFHYDGLIPGNYSLICRREGYGIGTRATGRTGDALVEIQMQREAVARGQVLDSETGLPVTRFAIVMSRHENLVFAGPRITQRFEDAEGRFEYLDLQVEGTVYLFALADGYAGGRSEAHEVAKGQDLDGVVIRVGPGATARGTVVDAAGQPVAGARVELVPRVQGSGDAGTFLQAVTRSMKTQSRTTTSGPDGRYVIERTLPGLYQIRARHPRFAESESRNDVAVPESGEVELPDLALSSGATIRGFVRDGDGLPLAAAQVQITEKGMFGGNTYTVVSGADGAYVFANVRPGIYTVRIVSRPGTASADLIDIFGQKPKPEVVVGNGDVLDLDLD